MSRVGGVKDTYRGILVSAITGYSPRECYAVHDSTALDNMLTRFVEVEQVIDILRHKGYGDFGMSLVDVANLIPEKAKT